MIKWTSAEDDLAEKTKAKADKKKTKKLKKEVRSLTQDSVITKLREELELSKGRADHFEQEYFNLKRSLIFQADQNLQAELYNTGLLLKAKDDEIEAMKWNNANENDDLGMQIKNLIEESESKGKHIEELKELNEKFKHEVAVCYEIDGLTPEEVNDQINQILKSK